LILISADKRAQYDDVARGMSLLQQAGVSKIGFKTDPPAHKDKNG